MAEVDDDGGVRARQEEYRYVVSDTLAALTDMNSEIDAIVRRIYGVDASSKYLVAIGRVIETSARIIIRIDEQFSGDMFLSSLAQLRQFLRGNSVTGPPFSPLLDRLYLRVSEHVEVVRAGIESLMPTDNRSEFHDWSVQMLGEASYALNSVQLYEARKEVDEARDEVKAIAATANLSADFETAAKEEWRHANQYRYAALGFALGAVFISIGLALYEKDLTWGNQLIKVVSASPLFAVAFYLSSEARDHRAHARRAREWQVRLNTVRNYTEELQEPDRSKVRSEFGSAVFKEPAPIEPGQAMGDTTSQFVEQVAKLAEIFKPAR